MSRKVIPMPTREERLAELQARALYEAFLYFNSKELDYSVRRWGVAGFYSVSVFRPGRGVPLVMASGPNLTTALAEAVEKHRNLPTPIL